MVFVLGHFQLRLNRPDVTFHESVVVAITYAAHALFHFGSFDYFSMLLASVLAGSVGMMNKT